MVDAAGRWFMSALIVSAGSLVIVTTWNSSFSLQEVVLIPLMLVIYALYAALYIFPACVLACILDIIGRRLRRPSTAHHGVLAVVTGTVCGVAVMMVGPPKIEPVFVCVAAVAGGTGGAMSASSIPMFSRRGAMTLVVGVLVSAVVSLGVQHLA